MPKLIDTMKQHQNYSDKFYATTPLPESATVFHCITYVPSENQKCQYDTTILPEEQTAFHLNK